MTRLFIRFYVGVLIVLFLAWYIHGAVLKQRADAEWVRVVEQAHGGGVRLIASELNAAPAGSRGQLLNELREQFDYPLEVVATAELPDPLRRRISGGDQVASFRSDEIVVAALDGGTEVVRLGPFPDYDLQEIEESLGGWMRLVADKLDDSAGGERAVMLADLQSRFEIAIEIVDRRQLPDWPQGRLVRGEDIVFFSQGTQAEEQWFAATPLAGGTEVVRFGPFPSFQQIEQKAATTTLALVLFPAALAIALLLRPVARQLRLVERTAGAIAGGDFSARVDERKVNSARTLAQAFNNMAGRTETMLRTQRELLQAVSHELRTPLSRIHFAIDLIREAKSDDQREQRLCSLEHAAQELDDLVGELLRYVRLETSEPKLDWETIELLPVLESLIEKHALLYPSISFTVAGETPEGQIMLWADRPSLERALGNLLANAGRFAKTRVMIGAEETEQGFVIDVDDDGPGIDPADRTRVFDPFVRMDESGRGAGLGLALVRRIVTHHGGSVTALESPLGGCRIRSLWPRGTAARQQGGSQSSQVSGAAIR